MYIEELLKKIEDEEVKDGSIFNGGDFFYYFIVIDKKLYIINETTRQLILVDSHDIGRMIKNKWKLYQYKKVID